MRIASILVLFMVACSSPPTDPRWIHAPTDYGLIVHEGQFVQPPSLPLTVCVGSVRNRAARFNLDLLVEGLVFWQRNLGIHLKCSLFEARPAGDNCDIEIITPDEIEYIWTQELAIASFEVMRKGSELQISGCRIAIPDQVWELSRAEAIIAHELGHCLGLNDDPFFGTPPRSIMESTFTTTRAGLTEMDARLLIGGLTCH